MNILFLRFSFRGVLCPHGSVFENDIHWCRNYTKNENYAAAMLHVSWFCSEFTLIVDCCFFIKTCNNHMMRQKKVGFLSPVSVIYKTTKSKENMALKSWHPGGICCYCSSTCTFAEKLYAMAFGCMTGSRIWESAYQWLWAPLSKCNNSFSFYLEFFFWL